MMAHRGDLLDPHACSLCDEAFVDDESVFLYEEYTTEGWAAVFPVCYGCGVPLSLRPGTRLRPCVYSLPAQEATDHAQFPHPG